MWTFKLRQGVKFHNGDPFTSADAKFSLERTYDPNAKTMVATVFTTIDKIEAPDPHTLVIHTKKPDPLLPARLAFYGGQIVPKRYVESVGNDAFNARPVGTGPISLSSWVKDDKAVFDAYGGYWGGKGEVDIITQVPPDQEDRIRANASTRVDGALYAGLYCLGVNSKRPPLDNPLVKQALSLAIDRDLIVKELWQGRGIVPSQPIAKGDSFFDTTLPPLAHNPKEARERLKKAGYKGEEIFLETTVAYVAQDKAMSEAIAAMWKDVGVNVKVEVVEYSVRAQKSREKSFKGLWWGDPTSTLGDPDGMMWRLLGPGGIYDYWRDAKFDELGNAARFSIDERFRAYAYIQLPKIFLLYLPSPPFTPSR